MKYPKQFLILSLLLVFAALFAAGAIDYNTSDFFSGTAWKDSLNTAKTYTTVKSTTAADTLTSIPLTLADLNLGTDAYIHVRRDTIVSGTATTLARIGLYRGDSYSGGTAYEWHVLARMNSEGDYEAALVDSLWWSKKMTSKIKIEFQEQAAQQQYYSVDFFGVKLEK